MSVFLALSLVEPMKFESERETRNFALIVICMFCVGIALFIGAYWLDRVDVNALTDVLETLTLLSVTAIGALLLTKFLMWAIAKAFPTRPFLCFSIVTVSLLVMGRTTVPLSSDLLYVLGALYWYWQQRKRLSP